MKDKKLLFIAREVEYKLTLELIKKSIKDGILPENIYIFFIEVTDIIFKYSDGIKQTKNSKIIPKENIISIYDEYKSLHSNLNNLEKLIDYEYVDTLENKYGNIRNLWVQAISDYKFINHHHWQYFYFPNHKEILYYMQEYYKKVEKLFELHKFNYVIDTNYPNIGRSIIFEVARYNKVSYLTPIVTRIDKQVMITNNFGLYTDHKIENRLNDREYDISFGLKKLKELEESLSETYEAHEKNLARIKKRQSFIGSLKHIFVNYAYSFKARLLDKRYFCKFPCFNKFASVGHKVLIHYFLYFYRTNYIRIFFYKVFEKNKLENEKYVYYPLHTIPENSTIVNAPYFLDEIENIKLIARSLPMNYKLYIKENFTMIGDRPLNFYKEVNSIPNVKLIDPHLNSKEIIKKSMLTITVTGTAALESVMLGKNAIIFGHANFEQCDGIFQIGKNEDLFKLIKKAINYKLDKTNIARYVTALREYSDDLDLAKLLYQHRESDYDQEFINGSEKLYKLFRKEMKLDF